MFCHFLRKQLSDSVVPSAQHCIAAGWELERATAAAFMGDAASEAATSPFNKASAIMAASVVDCAGAVVYFVITFSLILLARRRAEDADTHTVTIHDYSVYVRKLPHDATSSELVEFFSQWGEVSVGLLPRLQVPAQVGPERCAAANSDE
jgi:hypothetical protein